MELFTLIEHSGARENNQYKNKFKCLNVSHSTSYDLSSYQSRLKISQRHINYREKI